MALKHCPSYRPIVLIHRLLLHKIFGVVFALNNIQLALFLETPLICFRVEAIGLMYFYFQIILVMSKVLRTKYGSIISRLLGRFINSLLVSNDTKKLYLILTPVSTVLKLLNRFRYIENRNVLACGTYHIVYTKYAI